MLALLPVISQLILQGVTTYNQIRAANGQPALTAQEIHDQAATILGQIQATAAAEQEN